MNDDVVYDLDGSRVIYGGVPVTLWEWVGKHRLPHGSQIKTS